MTDGSAISNFVHSQDPCATPSHVYLGVMLVATVRHPCMIPHVLTMSVL